MARLCVLLAAVCFGTTGTAQALGPDGTEPLAVGASRILVCALVLGAIAWRLAPAAGSVIPWDRRALAVAGLGIAAYQASFFTAVSETGVAVGTVVAIGSGPAFTGLLGRVVEGEPLTGRWAAATGLASVGVALMALSGGSDAAISPTGIALALVAGASYGTYTVASKRLLGAGHAGEAVMARAFGVGAVLLLPALVLTAGPWLWSPGGIALVAYLGVVPTAVAYLLFARGLRELASGETATLTLAEPLTATALGCLVLGERLAVQTVFGAALVVLGLLALGLGRGRRRQVDVIQAVGAKVPA